MGRIQSNVGLITGVPIMDTVDQLMQLAARPRDMLQERNNEIREKQAGITMLASLVYATKVSVTALGKESTYNQRKVASSDPGALMAMIDGDPPLGSYEFTPLQMAQSHKMLSTGFRSKTDPIGSGTVTVRFGDHVQRSASLNLLNQGEGIRRGKIRIVDRSGDAADIDLSAAQSLDDVLEAINGNSNINVTATTRDGSIRLIDNTGQTSSNLKVLEVNGGATAQSLGLGGIDVAADTADGADLLALFDEIDLADLNDGGGVTVSTSLPDIEYTLRDGTTGTIDFSVAQGSSENQEFDVTLGDVVDRINEQSEGKLLAEIAADGRRLQITDTTTGDGAFTLASLYGSEVVADLGLDTEAVDGVITGRRLIGGLRTVALSSLGGGRGLGELGLLDLTDRGGLSDSVDLSGAETLEDVVELINTASVNIRAQINAARNGFELFDHSGGTAGNLIVANGDETNTADKLQIAADTAVNTVNSGDLHLQVISENTLLSSLNGGAGVALGRFTLIDSNGRERTIDLRDDEAETVGDVLRSINRQHLGARAEINETGDGILLRDTAGGGQTLRVLEAGGTTAHDLGLLRTAETVEVEGESQQHIDGSMTHVIAIGASDSLTDVVDLINGLGAGFSAGMLSDGSTRPWHLTLMSDQTGRLGSMVVDTSAAGFRLDDIAQGQDAMLGYGPASTTGTNIIATSGDGKFDGLVEGLSLEMLSATGSTVSVEVSSSYSSLTAAAKNLVENYNRYRDELTRLTRYDPETDESAVLTGDVTALKMDIALTELVTGRFTTSSPFRSLEEVGIMFNDTGKLQFDELKFNEALAEDPDAVREFFLAEDVGVAARFAGTIERVAGEDEFSMLSRRLDAIDRQIADNEERLARMDASLERERERMLTQFYNMELAVARIQDNLTALDSISWITDQYKSSNSGSG